MLLLPNVNMYDSLEVSIHIYLYALMIYLLKCSEIASYFLDLCSCLFNCERQISEFLDDIHSLFVLI